MLWLRWSVAGGWCPSLAAVGYLWVVLGVPATPRNTGYSRRCMIPIIIYALCLLCCYACRTCSCMCGRLVVVLCLVAEHGRACMRARCHFGSRLALSDGFSRPPYPGRGVVGHLPAVWARQCYCRGSWLQKVPGGRVPWAFPARGCGGGWSSPLLARGAEGWVRCSGCAGPSLVGGAPH